MPNEELKITIQNRAIQFGIKIIGLVNSLPKTPAGFAIASQLIRSGTSIGANIHEAQSAASKRDFIHCMTISLKESREALYWLILLEHSELVEKEKTSLLLRENDEIIRILVTIVKKSKNNS